MPSRAGHMCESETFTDWFQHSVLSYVREYIQMSGLAGDKATQFHLFIYQYTADCTYYQYALCTIFRQHKCIYSLVVPFQFQHTVWTNAQSRSLPSAITRSPHAQRDQ